MAQPKTLSDVQGFLDGFADDETQEGISDLQMAVTKAVQALKACHNHLTGRTVNSAQSASLVTEIERLIVEG